MTVTQSCSSPHQAPSSSALSQLPLFKVQGIKLKPFIRAARTFGKQHSHHLDNLARSVSIHRGTLCPPGLPPSEPAKITSAFHFQIVLGARTFASTHSLLEQPRILSPTIHSRHIPISTANGHPSLIRELSMEPSSRFSPCADFFTVPTDLVQIPPPTWPQCLPPSTRQRGRQGQDHVFADISPYRPRVQILPANICAHEDITKCILP